LAANGGSFVFSNGGSDKDDGPGVIEEVVVVDPGGEGNETGDAGFVELPGGDPIESGIIITDRPSNTGKEKGDDTEVVDDEPVAIATPIEEPALTGQVKIMSQPSNASVFI